MRRGPITGHAVVVALIPAFVLSCASSVAERAARVEEAAVAERPRRMPAIVADFVTVPELSRIEFECEYSVGVKERDGDTTRHLSRKIVVPGEGIPRATAGFTRHLILTRVFSDPMAWGDGFWGVSLGNHKGRGITFSLYLRPFRNNYRQTVVPGIWHYRLSMKYGKSYPLARFLVSEDGHILYPERDRANPWLAWGVGWTKVTPEGVFLDIIDDPRDRLSMQDTGRVTEYFYSFGETSLRKLRIVPERVNVMHYINNHFDGLFWNGKDWRRTGQPFGPEAAVPARTARGISGSPSSRTGSASGRR